MILFLFNKIYFVIQQNIIKNLNKLVFFILTLFFIFANILFSSESQIENPKNPITKLGVRYNDFYNVLEIENKLIFDVFKIKRNRFNLTLFSGVNLHTQAPEDLRGHYAVYDLFGIIGFVSKIDISQKMKLKFYPLYHESAHFTDGLLTSPNRDKYWLEKMTEEELDGVSQEAVILDFSYFYNKQLTLFYGGGYYYHTTSRDLDYFLHLGNNYFFDSFNIGSSELFYSSYFGYLQEEIGDSYSVNLGLGYTFKKAKLLINFERQRGLGKDYRAIQNKYGIEVIYGR